MPVPIHCRKAALAAGTALAATSAIVALGPWPNRVAAGSAVPRVVDVPSRPAFVKPPRRDELPARPGQTLAPASLLRTEKPGRLQVLLADGRSFRLGGDSLLRLGATDLELQRGQIIAWIRPGAKPAPPLRVRTRVGTASIVGTTLFIDASPEEVRVFSWEGEVAVEAPDGRRFRLSSGEELIHANGGWTAPRRLSQAEAQARRRRSVLVDGFAAPMETLPMIEKELGIGP